MGNPRRRADRAVTDQPCGASFWARFCFLICCCVRFPECLDDVAAPAERAGNLRERVDLHPTEIAEAFSARRVRIERRRRQHLGRRSGLAGPIELVDKQVPGLHAIWRTPMNGTRRLVWWAGLFRHGFAKRLPEVASYVSCELDRRGNCPGEHTYVRMCGPLPRGISAELTGPHCLSSPGRSVEAHGRCPQPCSTRYSPQGQTPSVRACTRRSR